MSSRTRRAAAALLAVFLYSLLCVGAVAAAQISPLPPAATAEEVRIYEAFRAWITSQPVTLQRAADDVVFERYAAVLRAGGRSEVDAASTVELLEKLGDRAEVERWNRILTSPRAPCNTAPNRFLVEAIKALRPGRALDVGMGQGRNTIFLAQQGWDSVGFDPADRAVAAAQEQAARLGVTITSHVARAEDFDWGDAQWDLIVLCYVGGRDYVNDVVRALRPGGMVMIEGFHRDATRSEPIGGGVVFDSNELLNLYGALRVIRYEDVEGVGDFGLKTIRLVRLLAQKP